MAELPNTGVVIPCYNEAKRLDGAAFLTALASRPWLSFLFVDDGSDDGTAELLDELHTACPDQLQVLHLGENNGKAEAVRRGMLAATSTEAVVVGYLDADLATPIAEVDRLCSRLVEEEAFLVMGVRVPLRGTRVVRDRSRHLLGRLFAMATGMALGTRFYDTQCGAKLFRNGVLCRGLFVEPFAARWIFDVELLGRLIGRADLEAEARIVEQPLAQWHDVAGSKLRAGDFLRAAADLATIAAERWQVGGGTR